MNNLASSESEMSNDSSDFDVFNGQVEDKLVGGKKSKKSKKKKTKTEEPKEKREEPKEKLEEPEKVQHGYTHAYIQEDLSKPIYNPQHEEPILPLHPSAAHREVDEYAPKLDMKEYHQVPHGYRHV